MATFDKALKQLVWTRDGGHCWRCYTAVWQGDVHHRRARGMGGRDSHEAWINAPENLLLLCRGCHDWIEEHRREARWKGWLLGAGDVPSEVPVHSPVEGVWYLLHGEDYRTPTATPYPSWERAPAELVGL